MSMLRMGILGTARIAATFTRAVATSDQVRIVAIASRDAGKARRFAQEHGIGQVFDSYEAMLRSTDIDAIYNPLPNTLHARWSIAALQSGKHVLCEKPLAMSVTEARDMFEAARGAGRVLVEGYPYRYQPICRRLQELLARGAIGPVRMIQAWFGFTMQDAGNIRLQSSLGGGSLLDAGSYPLSLVRMIAGRAPRQVAASATWTQGGVDQAVMAQFEFDEDLMAQVACSFGTAPSRHALIAGAGGIIETTFVNHPPMERPASLLLREGIGWEAAQRYEVVEAPAVNGFLAEADAFARRVREGAQGWSGTSPEESIDIARMIAAIQRSVASGQRDAV
ncbi:MAG: Gfo/Idh/MocA family oxidoreductase [Steroidobacteraceae bacterium]